MKALKITIVGLLLSGLAIGQSTDAKRELLQVPDVEPIFKSGEFGVRYMPSYTSMELRSSGGTIHKSEFIVGHGFGALLAINTKHIGLQLEVIYNSLWQKYKDHSMDREVHLNYVTIPLLLTLNTNKSKPVNLHVAVGPQLGINVGSKVETNGNGNGNGNGSDTLQAILAVKKSDFGIAYGAGIEFALNPARSIRLGVGFRGVYGFIDISDKSATTTTKQYYILDRTNIETYAGYIGLSFLF
ncbi:MAG: porin family protein [Bacteroidota bacterium]